MNEKKRKNILLSMDWDLISIRFFAGYLAIPKEWKKAYEEAMEWGLNFLKQKKLTITFFCCPENAAMFPDYVKKIKKDGHQVGLHIHTIDKNTSFKDKKRIIIEGKNMLEHLSQQKIEWFRGGMFYLDKEITTILTELEFKGDSSLVPDRKIEKWISGKYSAKYMELDMPMDYRGFPETPYYLLPSLLEIPLSRYSFNFSTPEIMLKSIEKDTNNLSVIYLHLKNLDGMVLKQSMEGRMKTGFIRVIDKLIERKFMFLEYDNILGREKFPKRFDLFKKLYPFDTD